MKEIKRVHLFVLLIAFSLSCYNSSTALGSKQATVSQINPVRTEGPLVTSTFAQDLYQNLESLNKQSDSLQNISESEIPQPSEWSNVVIVGGGLSGLSAAYYLRKENPILLEQSETLGGHAQGATHKGVRYSTGGAYVSLSEKGTPIDLFYEEIGLSKKFHEHTETEPIVVIEKKFRKISDFWKEGTDPHSKEQAQKLFKHFEDLHDEKNDLKFPKIPATDKDMRHFVNQLDRKSFRRYLEDFLGEPLHPHLSALIEHYCWTTFGGSASEVSAASGLNFYAGDIKGEKFLAGGNAGIAEAILVTLARDPHFDLSRLRTKNPVVRVKVKEESVWVTYRNQNQELKTIQAKYVLMSCPKFIVVRILSDIEPERRQAIESIKYRTYFTASLFYRENLKRTFYDLMFLEPMEKEPKDIQEAARKQKATDIIYANYLQSSSAENDQPFTIINLYRTFPYETHELSKPDIFSRVKREFEEQIRSTILPMLHLIADCKSCQNYLGKLELTVHRWTNALPLSEVGNIANGKVDVLRRPFKERVFFAEQGNWTLPSVESGFTEALEWSTEIQKRLMQRISPVD